MSGFIIRFLFCNIFICVIIGVLSAVKQIFRKHLTSRMQYNLWFLLLALLAIPFIPVRPIDFLQIFSWLRQFRATSSPYTEAAADRSQYYYSSAVSGWINDFAVSVSGNTVSVVERILCIIWIAGIIIMTAFMLRAAVQLNRLKQSSLPLQNKEVLNLYRQCLDEMHIAKEIPVSSTVYLKSPIFAGLLKPRIYLPVHLISDYNATDMRYMLLHELQHYKHKDAFSNYLMNIAGVLYWFNPLIWYALKEMRNDREVACDSSVLELLNESEYRDYGSTLINFAEKISVTPFPFAAGISGNMKQLTKRITNIASYKKTSARERRKGIATFTIIACILFSLSPALSTYAADTDHYEWQLQNKNIAFTDFSSFFGKYEGSFVLYDLENDSWNIYDMEHASERVSPDSTYKIYDALFGLEEGIITPEQSLITWDGTNYPFEVWNSDQNLQSAMKSSVNWYFQKIDRQLGAASIQSYIQKISYGNENVTGDLASYWMESSLKISPIEQVELLTGLYNNDFCFFSANIKAVKDSIFLFSSEMGSFYGKTGTGRINNQNVNGWFIGYTETTNHTYFFAVNIAADTGADGSTASEITLSILADMGIWE